MSEWMPIETASEGIPRALLFGYPFGFRSIWIGRPHGFDATDATHWMPLPEPPKDAP